MYRKIKQFTHSLKILPFFLLSAVNFESLSLAEFLNILLAIKFCFLKFT